MKTYYQAGILLAAVLASTYIARSITPSQDSSQGSVSSSVSGVTATQSVRPMWGGVPSASPAESSELGSLSRPPMSEAAIDIPVVPGDDSSRSCAVGAQIYMAQNLTTGAVEFEKNIRTKWPIASITKLMTASLAYDLLDPKQRIEITPEIIAQTEGYASFSAGEVYSANDLIRAALSFSSNDAAIALGRAVGEEEFVRLMNARAKEWLMNDTSFVEPSGLSYLNQSTAQDLSILLRTMHEKYPALLATTRLTSVSLLELTTGKTRKFNNIDLFAGRADFLGGKTGLNDQSGENLITLFQKNGSMYALIVLSSTERFKDTERLLVCSGSR